MRLGIESGQIPKTLYKYYRLDQNLLDALTNDYIWFSKPLSFNDPFDCNILIETEASYEELRNYYLKYNFSEKVVNEKVLEFSRNPIGFWKNINNIARKTVNNHGVACFSLVHDNILMWSHYTKNHMGVCVKYDLRKILKEEMTPINITYQYDYPKFNYIHGEFLKTFIGTKSIDWHYENEYRIISKHQGKNYIEKDSIIEIIFGCKTTRENCQRVINLIAEKGIPISYKIAKLKER